MLARLIALSLKHASLVVVAAGLLLAFAGMRVSSMPVDVFPELNAPTVVVIAESGGLSADEVEMGVTFPIETAVNGLPGLRRVRSSSAPGLSFVWAEFAWGVDIFRARQMVSERLASVRDALPPGVHAEITPVTSITGEVMLLALSSPDGKASAIDLRSFAEFDLRNRLLAVPGVAQVVAIGGDLPQFQVNVKQDRLALYGLTITDVVEAARAAHSTSSAGYLPDADHQELPIRQLARVRDPRDISASLIRYHQGAAVTIGDVADVTIGAAPRRGAAADKGAPAVVVSIQKSPDANTLTLTSDLDRVLDQAEKALPEGVHLNREAFRAASFISRSLHNVLVVARDAVIIVAVILILFLLNARTTIITLTALPLSIAVALLALWAMGMSINVMTLGGLAVAIGELVDDAVIDVENVFRRLRENAALAPELRRDPTRVIEDASNEIRSSVVFATVIICMVFLPLLFLAGLEGRFFRPLGVAYIVSIMASLVVALTVTPALCKLLLARVTAHGEHHDGPLVRILKRYYEPALARAIALRKPVLAGAAALTLAALALGATFGRSFLPTFNEGTYTVFLLAPAGTSLDESNRLARGVETRLAQIPGVHSVTRRTGRAERDEHAEPVSSSEIEVALLPDASATDVRREIDAILAGVPGVTTMVGQPIEHRLSHILSGTPAAIAVNVFGDDLSLLRSLAKQIETELRSLPGARDVNANREVMVASVPIAFRHADLAAAGLTPAAAADQVRQLIAGDTVAEVARGAARYELVVRLAEEERRTVDQIRDVILTGSGGALVRLREVADVGLERTSNLIARENARRKAVVSVNVAHGANLGDLAEEVKRRVDPIVAAAGCQVTYGGQFEAQQSASKTILVMGLGVAAVMFGLLRMSTGSNASAALVMLNLPLALIGGVAAVFLVESESPFSNTLALFGFGSEPYIAPVLSIASLVGFITLFGIAVRNGILLVNHYEHLRAAGHPLAEAVRLGSMERLVPILMTALTAALGLLPLALAGKKPGNEILAPLAVVVLGGLATSTILNLFVIPAGYVMVFGRVNRAAAPVAPPTPDRNPPLA